MTDGDEEAPDPDSRDSHESDGSSDDGTGDPTVPGADGTPSAVDGGSGRPSDGEPAGSIDGSEHDEGVSTLARQGGITFLGNVLNGVFGFAIVMLMTRYVSPSVYGLWVLATSVILFLQVIANLGLPLAIDYFVPQYLVDGEYGKAKGVILQVTLSVLGLSAVVGIALTAGAGHIADFFREPSLRVALWLLVVTIPMLAIYRVLLTSFYSIKKLQYRVIMRDVVRPTVRFAVTAGLLLVGWGLLGLVVGYVVGLLAAITVGTVVFVYKAWTIVSARVELVPPGPLISYSVPLAMTSVVFVLMGHVDYFVVGFFRSSDEVGIYRVGYMLGSSLMIIFKSLAPVFKPLIAEKRDDTALVQQRFRVMARWIAGFTIPIAIMLSLGAPDFLSVMYTPQYAEAGAVVALLCVAFLFNVTFGGPDGTLLQGLGYSRVVFFNTLVLFVANFAITTALVPVFGFNGAAVGSASALILVGLLTIGELYYLDGVHTFTRDFGKIVFAGVPATVAGAPVVYLVDSDTVTVAVLPIVVVGTYVLTLVATDAFTDDDARMAAEFSPGLRRILSIRS